MDSLGYKLWILCLSVIFSLFSTEASATETESAADYSIHPNSSDAIRFITTDYKSEESAVVASSDTLRNDSLRDSIPPVPERTKHFWRAAGETFGLNMSLWGLDRYILDGQYAHISFSTIRENFRHGFSWDNDHLSTNMFAHPYNGSLYYNAGRSNGYNFWQSELFAISGSAMWELFMEREYPSTNDIIATPIGGAALGEVFFRVSDLLIDDRTRGWERFEHELAAFIIDPMRGLTRIFSGEAWRYRPTSGRSCYSPELSLEVGIGFRSLMFHDGENLTKAGATALINLEYGDRYSPRSRKPYDYFNVLVELDVIKTQPILNRLEIKGRLLSRDIICTDRCDLSIGMYQHFDYFDSDTITRRRPADNLHPCVVPYKLGTPASIGAGLMFRRVGFKKAMMEAYVHVNGVALAGVLSDYYRFYHRNYNWASGFSVKTGITLSLPEQKLQLMLANRYYRLYTWNGWYRSVDANIEPADRAMDVQGDNSSASFNYFEGRINIRVRPKLYLTVGADWYYRNTHYHDLMVCDKARGGDYVKNPKIVSQQVGIYMMTTFQF